MASKIIRIATRKSPLALWQAHHVGNCLKAHWPQVDYTLVPMLTSGDKFFNNKLQMLGGKGLFIKELEEGLLSRQADIAVHSMKDMPVQLPQGLVIAAICQRDNPLDAFVSAHYSSLASLPRASLIGTASLRRQSQLLAFRSDLSIKTLRGNINTRLEKLNAGEYDAIILAAAGLERLGMQAQIKEYLAPNLMLPSCAQGAMGVECLDEAHELIELLASIHHEPTAICVEAERHVSLRLGGNCHVPLAVFCQQVGQQQLELQAKTMSIDGKLTIANIQRGDIKEGLELANRCADALLAQGAQDLLCP